MWILPTGVGSKRTVKRGCLSVRKFITMDRGYGGTSSDREGYSHPSFECRVQTGSDGVSDQDLGDWLSVHGITPCPSLFALRFCIKAYSYKYCPTAAWHCVNEGYLMETAYLVIGAGAMRLAFADALHTEKPQSKIVIIEKRPLIGGH